MKFKKYSVIIYAIILFLLSVAFVVYIFPKEKKFQYSFSQGSPWLHENLIAPFNFPVYKSDEEITQEQDSIRINFIPYYVYDSVAIKLAVDDYVIKLEDIWQNEIIANLEETGNFKKNLLQKKFASYIILVDNLLQETFNKGVIEIPDSISEPHKFRFYLYDGKISKLNYATSYALLGDVQNSFDDIYIKSGLSETDSLAGFKIKNYNNSHKLLPSIIYDKNMNKNILSSLLDAVATSRGMVQKGELIIQKGHIVGMHENKVLLSLKKEVETDVSNVNHAIISFGISLLFLSLYFILFLYLFYHDRKILNSFKANTFFTLQMLLLIVSVVIIFKYTDISINVIPFTLIPLLLFTFYRFNVSFIVFLASILIAGFFAANNFEFVFIQTIAGLVAMFSLRNTRKRSQIFISTIYVFITYIVLHSGFILMKQGDFSDLISNEVYIYGISSALLVLYLPIVYLYEKIFGFLSDFTLMELCDTNNPALRQLSEKTPGTFQHSVQVANLVESVTRELGGNYLLARAGALYHDIGKSVNPECFIENQDGANIHDKLDYEESAQKIISHVELGVEIAKKHKIPAQVIDFITMHHGTSLTKYFYNSWINENPNLTPNITNFRYPGPKPNNIETVVMMMADAIEAASRTLDVYSPESIDKLVSVIIDSQLNAGQYDDVDITLKQISQAKRIFAQKISNIYHSRIVYPEINAKNN
ncbi:MAG: HDIG domain-containing protein [Bacteroidales bacterium]|nr:HDIG domain-containing protein [Bacteroidales bacterium]